MKSIVALGLALSLVACGGESNSDSGTGVGGSAGATGIGGQPGTGGTPSVGVIDWPPAQTSFVLTTTDMSQSLTGPAFSKTRLDLRAAAGGFEAAIGSRLACNVTVSTTEITLSGCPSEDSRTIHSVSLARAANGALTGKFVAQSSYDGLYQEDMIVSETIEFSGTVAVDQQAPDITIVAGVALPWNGLTILSSEGVDASAFAAAVAVVPQSGGAPAITWTPSLGTPEWSGAIGVVGTFSDWAALADGPSFDVTVGAVPDLNGNPSVTAKAVMQILALGQPLQAHDFESGLSLSATGDAKLESSAGICEAGACVSFGPGNSCQGAIGGIRGLLDTAGKSKVRIRSRVVADAATGLPELTLRLAAPTGEKSTAAVGHFDGASTPSTLGLDYGATFGDDVVPLPAASNVTGFEITLNGEGGYFCNPSANAALILESISVE
jgi:hypothetical protein